MNCQDRVFPSWNRRGGCAFIRRLRSIVLMAQPPLLSEEGNTLPCDSFTPSQRGIAATKRELTAETQRNSISLAVGCCHGLRRLLKTKYEAFNAFTQ